MEPRVLPWLAQGMMLSSVAPMEMRGVGETSEGPSTRASLMTWTGAFIKFGGNDSAQ